MPDAQHPAKTLRVWDILVRLFHWSLVICFSTAWFTSSSRDDTHQWVGLVAAGLIAFRIIWGMIGKPYARFSQFVRGPRKTLAYIAAILRGREARYIGHNPAGAMMVLALLTGVASTALTGWLMTTDAYFGDDNMQLVHSACAYLVVGLVTLHVAGVLLASKRHKENLVKAMIIGRKRAAQSGDIT
jgi:cytochrome b